MPKRTDIESILIVGSGPIVIGQVCEFDYSIPEIWYKNYSNNAGLQGTYADKYGRTISLFSHLYVVTGSDKYLDLAHQYALMAIEKLFVNGMFKGHPAKPYYEAMDGVGYLLYALLLLDEISYKQKI